jgi:hypothetical protein
LQECVIEAGHDDDDDDIKTDLIPLAAAAAAVAVVGIRRRIVVIMVLTICATYRLYVALFLFFVVITYVPQYYQYWLKSLKFEFE